VEQGDFEANSRVWSYWKRINGFSEVGAFARQNDAP
jgi:hypothetical protein